MAKELQRAFWEGFSGYLADPDGYLWEVVYNPEWNLGKDGFVIRQKDSERQDFRRRKRCFRNSGYGNTPDKQFRKADAMAGTNRQTPLKIRNKWKMIAQTGALLY